MNRTSLMYIKRLVSLVLSVTLVFGGGVPLPQAHAQPVPATLLQPSQSFAPVMMQGIGIRPDQPFHFDFFMGIGDTGLDVQSPEFKQESQKLVQYFLASLTIPEEDVWVNLGPGEDDRIMAPGFDQTAMGRDLLAQDYILKKLTASLMYPEEGIGSQFWDKVYEKAWDEYGTTEVPVDTFHKVWITPDEATLFRNENNIFTVENRLKVLLERDYVAAQGHMSHVTRHKKVRHSERAERVEESQRSFANAQDDDNSISTQIIKDIIIPAIEREVNTGEHFAPLRQIYSAMILATWYKRNLKQSVLNQVYADQGKVQSDKDANAQMHEIYDQYMESVKEGVFDYIKDEVTNDRGQITNDQRLMTNETSLVSSHSSVVTRRYFSGGANGYAGLKDFSMTANARVVADAEAHVTVRFDGRDKAMAGRIFKSFKSLADYVRKSWSLRRNLPMKNGASASIPVAPITTDKFSDQKWPDVQRKPEITEVLENVTYTQLEEWIQGRELVLDEIVRTLTFPNQNKMAEYIGSGGSSQVYRAGHFALRVSLKDERKDFSKGFKLLSDLGHGPKYHGTIENGRYRFIVVEFVDPKKNTFDGQRPLSEKELKALQKLIDDLVANQIFIRDLFHAENIVYHEEESGDIVAWVLDSELAVQMPFAEVHGFYADYLDEFHGSEIEDLGGDSAKSIEQYLVKKHIEYVREVLRFDDPVAVIEDADRSMTAEGEEKLSFGGKWRARWRRLNDWRIGLTEKGRRALAMRSINTHLDDMGPFSHRDHVRGMIERLSTSNLLLLQKIVDEKYETSGRLYLTSLPWEDVAPLIGEWVQLNHDRFLWVERSAGKMPRGLGDHQIRAAVLASLLKRFPDANPLIDSRLMHIFNEARFGEDIISSLDEEGIHQRLEQEYVGFANVWGPLRALDHRWDMTPDEHPEILWLLGGAYFPTLMNFLSITVSFKNPPGNIMMGYNAVERLATGMGVEYNPVNPDIYVDLSSQGYVEAKAYFDTLDIPLEKSQRMRPVIFLGAKGGIQRIDATHRKYRGLVADKGFTDMEKLARVIKRVMDETGAIIIYNREDGTTDENMTELEGLLKNTLTDKQQENFHVIPHQPLNKYSEQLKYMMFFADVVLSREGGSMHMAAALGVPVLNLFDQDVVLFERMDWWRPDFVGPIGYRELELMHGNALDSADSQRRNGYDAITDEEIDEIALITKNIFVDNGWVERDGRMVRRDRVMTTASAAVAEGEGGGYGPMISNKDVAFLKQLRDGAMLATLNLTQADRDWMASKTSVGVFNFAEFNERGYSLYESSDIQFLFMRSVVDRDDTSSVMINVFNLSDSAKPLVAFIDASLEEGEAFLNINQAMFDDFVDGALSQPTMAGLVERFGLNINDFKALRLMGYGLFVDDGYQNGQERGVWGLDKVLVESLAQSAFLSGWNLRVRSSEDRIVYYKDRLDFDISMQLRKESPRLEKFVRVVRDGEGVSQYFLVEQGYDGAMMGEGDRLHPENEKALNFLIEMNEIKGAKLTPEKAVVYILRDLRALPMNNLKKAVLEYVRLGHGNMKGADSLEAAMVETVVGKYTHYVIRDAVVDSVVELLDLSDVELEKLLLNLSNLSRGQVDAAMNAEAPGGIDLNADQLTLRGDDDGVMPTIEFDEAMIAEMREEIQSLVPVILNIQPITNMNLLLGLDGTETEDNTSKIDLFAKLD